MDHEDQRLGEAIRIKFEGDADPNWEGFARRLLAAQRRGESEMALRKMTADFQSKQTGRVIDADCRQVVALVQKVASNA